MFIFDLFKYALWRILLFVDPSLDRVEKDGLLQQALMEFLFESANNSERVYESLENLSEISNGESVLLNTDGEIPRPSPRVLTATGLDQSLLAPINGINHLFVKELAHRQPPSEYNLKCSTASQSQLRCDFPHSTPSPNEEVEGAYQRTVGVIRLFSAPAVVDHTGVSLEALLCFLTNSNTLTVTENTLSGCPNLTNFPSMWQHLYLYNKNFQGERVIWQFLPALQRFDIEHSSSLGTSFLKEYKPFFVVHQLRATICV